MAKPIFIIESPIIQTREEFDRMQKTLQNELNDYHVLMVSSDRDEFNFEVFYDKDFTHVNYDELKKIIYDKLNQDNQWERN